jgi:hypothetical protein
MLKYRNWIVLHWEAKAGKDTTTTKRTAKIPWLQEHHNHNGKGSGKGVLVLGWFREWLG